MPAKMAPKNTSWNTALPPLLVLDEDAAAREEITVAEPSHGGAPSTLIHPQTSRMRDFRDSNEPLLMESLMDCINWRVHEML